MSRIGQLLYVAAPPMITSELPSDLTEMPCKYAQVHLCLKCRICGAVSGTSRKITHSYDCRYAPKRDTGGPFVLGERRRAATEMTLGPSEAILQRECGFVSPYSIKTTLATYGAGPCVILAHVATKQLRNFAPTKSEYRLGTHIGQNGFQKSLNHFCPHSNPT